MKALAILQNADFEKPGTLPKWASAAGFGVSVFRTFEGELPSPGSFSHLVVLGTPHSVQDIPKHDWLGNVESLVKDALAGDVSVLGICFGAQLLAHLMGAEVRRGAYAEIGWHRLPSDPWPASFPRLGEGTLFQWHREYFEVPAGAEGFGLSAAGYPAGFCRGPRVLALSGHPEMDASLVDDYLARCWSDEEHRRELAAGTGRFRQSPEEMLAGVVLAAPFAEAIFRAWLLAE